MKMFVLPSRPYWSSFSTPQQSSIPLNVHSQYFSTRAIAQRRRRARQLAAITEIASAVKHADALSSLHARPSNLQQTRPTIQPPSSNDSQNGVLTNIDGRRSHQRSIPHMLIARRPFTDPTRPVSFAHIRQAQYAAAQRSTCVRGVQSSTHAPTRNNNQRTHGPRKWCSVHASVAQNAAMSDAQAHTKPMTHSNAIKWEAGHNQNACAFERVGIHDVALQPRGNRTTMQRHAKRASPCDAPSTSTAVATAGETLAPTGTHCKSC
ncbi:hypothetical protein BC826DRAFT_62808 [Russula brevipes]|nr:hypothetical protein BC826DRAFT_62808 [Russula brevipes]